jgi:single-strand DNA-binding protein
MGNLTRDPELRFTNNQMAVCKVGLAVNRRFKDSQSGDWREEPTFVDVTIFGKRAEAFEKYHRKGASAFFEGSLRLDTWEDKNGGGKRSKLYVVAENWEFVGGREGRSGGGGGGRGASSEDDWMPASAPEPMSAGGDSGTSGGYGAPDSGALDVDDAPF